MTSRSEVLVRFSDVGPRRVSWEARLSALTRSAVIAAIFRSGVLSRRVVDVRFSVGTQRSGVILAGPQLTPCGKFEVIG